MLSIIDNFSEEIENQSSLRCMVDYLYTNYTIKVQLCEFITVAFIQASFLNRLFNPYNYETRGNIQIIGETIGPALLIIVEVSQLAQIGFKNMYSSNYTKLFTDLLMPFALIFYYTQNSSMKLEDYDLFEYEYSVEHDL